MKVLLSKYYLFLTYLIPES